LLNIFFKLPIYNIIASHRVSHIFFPQIAGTILHQRHAFNLKTIIPSHIYVDFIVTTFLDTLLNIKVEYYLEIYVDADTRLS